MPYSNFQWSRPFKPNRLFLPPKIAWCTCAPDGGEKAFHCCLTNIHLFCVQLRTDSFWRSWSVQNADCVLQTYAISLFPANALFYAHSSRMMANRCVPESC